MNNQLKKLYNQFWDSPTEQEQVEVLKELDRINGFPIQSQEITMSRIKLLNTLKTPKILPAAPCLHTKDTIKHGFMDNLICVAWRTQEDDRVCQICASRNGLIFYISTDMDLDGAIQSYKSHIDCRCKFVKIEIEEEVCNKIIKRGDYVNTRQTT